MRIQKLVLVSFALMLLGAACGGQATEEALLEQILENSGEDIGDVDISTDGDEFKITVEGEDGETMSFGGGEVPEGMQTPVPDGGKVTSSFTAEGDMSVALAYPNTSFDQLVSFYDSELDPDSEDVDRYESTFESDDGTIRNVSWSATDGNWNVTVNSCYSLETGDLDSACVTIYESDS